MDRPNGLRSEAGFTLIEIVIAIVLMGLLAVAGSTMVSDTFKTSRMVDADQANSAQLRYAIDRLAREIREVQFDGAANTFKITSSIPASGTASSMVFVKSTALSGSSTITVTISKDAGGNVNLGYSSPAVTSKLVSGVTDFELKFMGVDNAVTTSKTLVRFVQIRLGVGDSVSGQVRSESTRVQFRGG